MAGKELRNFGLAPANNKRKLSIKAIKVGTIAHQGVLLVCLSVDE